MNNSLPRQHPSRAGAWAIDRWVVAAILSIGSRDATDRGRMEGIAVVGIEVPEGRPTSPHFPPQHRVKHRREVAGRGIDDSQYLGGRGLLVEGFGQFGRAV